MAEQWTIIHPGEGEQGQQAQQNPSLDNAQDWQITTPGYKGQGEEGLLTALAKSPFRIGEDIFKGGLNAVKNAPDYLQKAKTEIPGLLKTLLMPGNINQGTANQMGAGVAELGHEALNFPHDAAQYASKRLNLLPESIANKIPQQRDISADISDLFGEPKQAGDAFLRGGIRNLPQILGGGAAAKHIFGLTKRGIVNDVINTKNAMENKYSGPEGLYNSLFEEATNKGAVPAIDINKIDIQGLGGKERIKRNYTAIDNLNNPNLSFQEHQDAIKELGKIEREMQATKEKQGTLTNAQDRKLHAARDAKNYIQENMFKNKNGDLISDLLNQHKKIQKGYATEVVPYNIPELSEYQKGKASLPNVYKELLKDPFYAQRGKYHRIKERNIIGKATGGVALEEALRRLYMKSH